MPAGGGDPPVQDGVRRENGGGRRWAARVPVRLLLVVVMVVGSSAAVDRSTAVFVGSTGASGSVTAAASFVGGSCSSPGGQSVEADMDTWVNEADPDTNNGNIPTLHVMSAIASNPARRRTFVRFPLPSVPAGCAMTSAMMTLTVASYQGGRDYVVERATQAWDESTLTWNNQGTVTTAGSSTAPTTDVKMSWNVTTMVAAQYTGANYGFRVSDTTEISPSVINVYYQRGVVTASDRPVLDVQWS